MTGGRTESRLGTGSVEGAVSTGDLAPLAFCPTGFAPVRGFDGLPALARPTAADSLVGALDHPGTRPAWDLPRGCLIEAGVDDPALPGITASVPPDHTTGAAPRFADRPGGGLWMDAGARAVRHTAERGLPTLTAGRTLLEHKAALGFGTRPLVSVAVPRPFLGTWGNR